MQVTGNNITTYYKAIWHTPAGVQVAELDTLTHLSYARGVSKPGWATVRIPADALTWQQFYRVDAQLEILRRVEGHNWYTEMGTHWLMRRFDQFSDRGARFYEAAGPSAYNLVSRRIVAYAAGSAEADQSNYADDLMKLVVSQNLGSGATAGRNIATYLTVDANASAGPSIAKAFSRRDCGVVLSELTESSAQAGTIIYPDIIWNGAAFKFKTYPNQRGVNRSAGTVDQIVFAEEFDNLENARLSYDHTDEITYVYAGGQGEGSARAIAVATDLERVASSPFNRIEKFINATHCTTTTQLEDEAKAALRAGRPVISLSGKIKQTPVCIYGLHWGLGDRVVARSGGIDFTAWIDPVSVTVSPEGESIEASIYAVQE